MSHSKRNTSLAFFTAHERSELKSTWGSRATRLTRESFLPFGSCQLCLLSARDPVTCPSHGHLFCRECAVSNLLAQSKELKRLKKERERERAEDEVEREAEHAETRLRAVEEFEKAQMGLGARSEGRKAGTRVAEPRHGREREGGRDDGASGQKGVKRKLDTNDASLAELANEGGQYSKRRASDRDGSTGSELPAFWVPARIPTNQKSDAKTIKPHPTCPAAEPDQPHDFSLKSLVTVKFHEEGGGDDDKAVAGSEVGAGTPTRTCPSCTKALSNATKAVVAKPCGHVVCGPCSEKFQRPVERSAHDVGGGEGEDGTVRCYVCAEDCTPGRKGGRKEDGKGGKGVEMGLVVLSCEGTGFAGGGKNMVKKHGVAFQC